MGVKAEDLGANVPRRGNALSQRIGEMWLKLIGWRVTGEAPNMAKAVCIGAPHTSNRDGYVAVAVAMALRLRITVMAKAEIFIGPLATLFHWMGVMPIYRDKARGLVEQSADYLRNAEKFWLGIAPEGTRHASPAWKMGFYYIALKAEVPIIPFILDYGRKELRFLPVFVPTGDMDADLEAIMENYRGIVPADPSRLSLPLRD